MMCGITNTFIRSVKSIISDMTSGTHATYKYKLQVFSFINSRHLKFSKFFKRKNRKEVTVESETCTGTAIYNIQGNKLLR